MPRPEEDIIRFGPFTKGINNVDAAIRLAADELLNAVNLDIDREGSVRRRPGYAKVIDEADTHSLFARDDTTAFYVSGIDLKLLQRTVDGTLTSSVLLNDALQLRKPVAYVEVNGDVYLSNGILTRRIRADNTVSPWGIPGLTVTPTLATGAGALAPGRYLVSLTFVTDEGEESGRTAHLPIELTAQGGITVSAIPTAASPVTHVRVYLSPTNGDRLYRYSDYPIGTTTVLLSLSATLGMEASRERLTPMPPTDMLEAYNGRIYGVAGRMVWFTEPLYYGLHNPRRNFLLFAEDIVLMKAVTDGIYFGTRNKTYWYAGGGPEDFVPRIVQHYGAIKGTGLTLRQLDGMVEKVCWFSERGLVVGGAGGALAIGDKARTMIGQFESGTSFFREKDGVRQVVGTMKFETRAPQVSNDYLASEQRRV